MKKKKIGRWSIWYNADDESVQGLFVTKDGYSLYWEVDGMWSEEEAEKLISEWNMEKDVNKAIVEIASRTWWSW